MTENRPTQPSRQHGSSEKLKTTEDGRILVPTGKEGLVLQVKPSNQPKVLSNIHQNLLEEEQGITYTTEPSGEKLIGVKKKK